MDDGFENANEPFLHVHVCVHCGSAFRREVFEGRAHTTGIYLCPKCGIEGPLNVEIRKAASIDGNSQAEGRSISPE